MKQVTLTVEERDYAIAIGDMRTRLSRQRKYTTHFGANDPLRDQRGAIGEQACSKLFNIPWNVSHYPDKVRGDLVLRSGVRIQVRAARYPNPCPPFTFWEHIFCYDADEGKVYVFVLANVDVLVVTVLGWCKGRDIPKIGKWSEDIPYPAYVIPVIDLTKFGNL